MNLISKKVFFLSLVPVRRPNVSGDLPKSRPNFVPYSTQKSLYSVILFVLLVKIIKVYMYIVLFYYRNNINQQVPIVLVLYL